MKKILLFIILLIIPYMLSANDEINVYLFYGSTCPHCEELREFLYDYLKDNEDVKLNEYEVWHNNNNKELFDIVKKKMNNEINAVPYLIIGEDVILGFSEKVTDEQIDSKINYCRKYGCEDNIIKLINDNYQQKENTKLNIVDTIKSGIKNKLNVSYLWIFLLIISVLFCINKPKKQIVFSLIYIFISLIVNFLLLNNYINISIFSKYITIIKALFAFILMISSILLVIKYIMIIFNKKEKKSINYLIYFLYIISCILITLLITFTINNPISEKLISYKNIYLFSYMIVDILLITLYIALNFKFKNVNYIITSSILFIISMLIAFNYNYLLL